MKKNRKEHHAGRVISLILALCVTMTFMSTTALAGVTEWGQTDNGMEPVKFWYSDAGKMSRVPENQKITTFEEGKTYSYIVIAKANENHTFASKDALSVMLNDEDFTAKSEVILDGITSKRFLSAHINSRLFIQTASAARILRVRRQLRSRQSQPKEIKPIPQRQRTRRSSPVRKRTETIPPVRKQETTVILHFDLHSQ